MIGKEMVPNSIGEYFRDVFGGIPPWDWPTIKRWEEMDSKDWPLNSVCGRAAQRIIDKAADLVSVMGESDDKQAIVKIIQEEILVICFG